MIILLLLILLPALVQAKYLKTCYRIYFLFLPAAESCVLYSKDGEKLLIKPWTKTTAVGRLVKPVNSWGEAVLLGLEPKRFSFYQREGSYVRDHFYLFKKNGVEYRIVRRKEDNEEVDEGFFESSVYLFDPFSTSLLVYLDTPNFKGGTIFLFYDGKLHPVEYRTLGEEAVKVMDRTYSTWKVLLIPRVDTKGVLKPKGEWLIWVDKDTNLPVKLQISFTIGSVGVYLEKIEGDPGLLKELKN